MRCTVLLGLVAVGCAPVTVPIAQPVDPAPPTPVVKDAPHCAEGAHLTYRRRLDATTELLLEIECFGEGAVATSTAVPYPWVRVTRLETGEEGLVRDDEEDDAPIPTQSEPFDVARFNRLSASLRAHIEAGDCHPIERDTRYVVGAGTDKWQVLCDAMRLRPLARSFEAALQDTFAIVDPRDIPEEPPADQVWPFSSDYWRDELGYYRTPR